MERIILNIGRLSKGFALIAKVFLVFMVLLTVTDVVLRYLGRPILGAYELVCYSSALTYGFALSLTSWRNSHISMRFFILKLPRKARKILNVATKCLGIGLFSIFGSALIDYGSDLREVGEVSVLMQIPFYVIVYALAVSCFCVCAVLFRDILNVLGGKYE